MLYCFSTMLGRKGTIFWICTTLAFLASSNSNRMILSRAVSEIRIQNSTQLNEAQYKSTAHTSFSNGYNAEGNQRKKEETTIIITSSLIPTHPSLNSIDRTIESLKYLHGISETAPIIITVDGMSQEDRESNPSNARRLAQYVDALKEKYTPDSAPSIHNSSNTSRSLRKIKVLSHRDKLHLIGSVDRALRRVHTEFVYVIQHDLPFISDVNHSALIQTMNDYPDEIRLVRFHIKNIRIRPHKIQNICGEHVEFSNDIVQLTKTHIWSDRNHLTRKAYYKDMFQQLYGWDKRRFMENIMKPIGTQNCSYWGTYLYGNIGFPPTIAHLNGRTETNATVLKAL